MHTPAEPKQRPLVAIRRCTRPGCYCGGEDLIVQCRRHARTRMHCHRFDDAIGQASLHAQNQHQGKGEAHAHD